MSNGLLKKADDLKHRDRGLGRHRHNDPRDFLHLARPHLVKVKRHVEPYPMYKIGDILNQGSEGTCVGHACGAWHNSRPVGFRSQVDHPYCVDWYVEATKIDPFPKNDGNLSSGTTVRAGLRIALERGFAKEFVSIATVEEFDAWMGSGFGGVIVGSSWLRSMDDVKDNGFTPVDLTSGERGGHAYFFFGKDKQKRRWYQNSWGPRYGLDGTGYFTDEGFRKLFTYDMEPYGMVQTGVAL